MQKADQIIWGGVGGMEHRDYPLRLPLTQGEGGILRGLRESRRGIAKRFPLLCKEGSGEVVLGRRDAGTTPSDSPLAQGEGGILRGLGVRPGEVRHGCRRSGLWGSGGFVGPGCRR